LSFFGYLRARRLMEGYWHRVAEMGKDDSPYRATFAQIICVAETDAEAERLYGPHVSYFFNRCLHVFPGFADAPGYRTIKTIQAEFLSQLTRPQLGLAASLSWGELIERGYIVAGSPETVRQRMEELIRTLRVGNIICGIHVGNMPPEKTRYSTELFAKKVMPQLKGIWKDYEGGERFWIHPLPKRAAPAPIAAEAAR
jgi:alkanesulfonate monooxygenase SsuD/methylene tetrahydromethanopterin reductase-like flavin-dependent oxidoreductase (luciferase family)